MRSYLALVLVMALWGSAFASSKVAVQEVPHEVAAVLRFGIGAVILLALQPVLGSRLSRRDTGVAAGLGMLGIFGYNVLFFLALTLAPSADGSVIVPVTAPVITVAVTAMLGQRTLTRRAVGGLGAAVGGAAVFFAGIPGGGGERLVGDLLFLAAAACWASYTMCGAPVLRRLPAFTVTTYATAAGAIALAIFAAPAVTGTPWSTLDSGFWLNLAYLAVLPTAVAYVLYYRAVHSVGPATAASAMFLVPVFGLACSCIVLGESITAIQATGAALMLVGAWLSTLTPRRKPSIIKVWRRSLSTSPNSAVDTGSAPSGQCPNSAPTSAGHH